MIGLLGRTPPRRSRSGVECRRAATTKVRDSTTNWRPPSMNSRRAGFTLAILLFLFAAVLVITPDAQADPCTCSADDAICLVMCLGHPPDPPDATRAGAIRYTIVEQFDLMATEVFISMKYRQSPSGQLYSGTYLTGYCKTSPFPGWNEPQCFSRVDSGPSDVWIEITGAFEHPQSNTHYVQRGKYFAYGTFWGYSCVLVDGALPYFWDHECAGWRN